MDTTVDTSNYTDDDHLLTGEIIDYILDQNALGDSVIMGYLNDDGTYDSDGLEQALIEWFEAKPEDRMYQIIKDFMAYYIRGLLAEGNDIFSISTMMEEGL